MSAGWGKTCKELKHDKTFSCTGVTLELMNGGEIIASAVSIHSNIDDVNATSRDGRIFYISMYIQYTFLYRYWLAWVLFLQ